jgi:superfamily II DNA/RNA helicase
MQELLLEEKYNRLKVIIIVPTSNLAIQVNTLLKDFKKFTKVKHGMI